MEIIDAYWEKRNLNVLSKTIKIGKDDNIAEIKRVLTEINSEYITLSIPTGYVEAFMVAQDLGYKYIENNITVVKKIIKEIDKNSKLSKIMNAIEYHSANKNEIEYILDDILNGNIFCTDKIAKDPYFGIKKSGKRYWNWAKDIINNRGEVYLISIDNENVGFVINKNDNSNYTALAGLLSKHKDSRFGLFVISSLEKIAFDNNKKYVITNISSNNLNVLKLYTFLEYEIKEINSIFIKHNVLI